MDLLTTQPNDHLGIIWSFLNPQDLLRSICISKRFKRFAIKALPVASDIATRSFAAQFKRLDKILTELNNTHDTVPDIIGTWYTPGITAINFSLYKSIVVFDKNIHFMALQCGRLLTSLDLSNCKCVTDSGIISITSNLTNLNTLYISNCRRVTNSGVISIANNLNKLIDLDISGTQITDRAVLSIADKLSNLISLYIAGCDITDRAVMTIADKLFNLTILDIGGNCYITDRAILAIADKLINLTNLSIGECKKITDQTIIVIADKLTKLTSLDVRYIRIMFTTVLEINSKHDNLHLKFTTLRTYKSDEDLYYV